MPMNNQESFFFSVFRLLSSGVDPDVSSTALVVFLLYNTCDYIVLFFFAFPFFFSFG